MQWLALGGTAFLVLSAIWLLLLAYRVVGKPPGKDPKYAAVVEYWAGTFKVYGVLGVIVLLLQVVVLLVEHR